MQKDTLVFDLLRKELERQRNGIELIASENFTSYQVMQAMGTVPTNKYAEGYPGKRYYGGCEVVDEIETLAIERLKKVFNASWANVQPHAGAQANVAVFLACLKPGDKIITHFSLYGGTDELVTKILPSFGITAIIADLRDLNKAEELIRSDKTIKMMYLETPANPNIHCVDLDELSRLAKPHGLIVACDHTFATPS